VGGRIVVVARGLWTGIPSQDGLSPGAVAIEDGKILKVGEPSNIISCIPKLYRLVRLENCYLLPGLINTHVHLTFSGGKDPLEDYMKEDDATLLLRALANAQVLLQSGVTTIRDCGSRGYGLVALKQEEFQKRFALPRILVSGPPITPTGGHLHWLGGEADGDNQIRAAVRLRAKKGVDSLKIIATGGQMTPGTLPELAAYTLGELCTAVAEARQVGLVTAAHCLSAPGIVAAARAGVQCLEHCAFFVRLRDGRLARQFDIQAAKIVSDQGCYVAPCLSAGYHKLDSIRNKDGLSPSEKFLLEQERMMFEHFAQLADFGIPMVVGTDAGVTLTPFDETYLELQLMVQAGFAPTQALQAATYNAARALGIEGEVGTIEPGKDADLIACLGNPIKDIRSLKEVVWVMRAGRVLVDRRPKEGTG